MAKDTNTEDTIIPTEIEVQPQPSEHPDRVNLAENEDIVEAVQKQGDKKYRQFFDDRDEFDKPNGIWNTNGFMFHCYRNATKSAAAQDINTDADTGCTLFYRQVRTVAAGILAVLFSKDIPAKFRPIFSSVKFNGLTEQAEAQAEQHNLLTKWTKEEEDFEISSIEALWYLIKQGNGIPLISWKYNKAERTDRVVSEWSEDGHPTAYEFETKDVVVDNRPEERWFRLQDVYFDWHIGNLQDQQAIVFDSFDDVSTICKEVRNGNFVNQEKIKAGHYYKGEGDDDREDHAEHQENRAMSPGDDTRTDQLRRQDLWIKAPIGLKTTGSDKGKSESYEWDEKKHPPKWYYATFEGGIKSGVCVQIYPTYDPDNEFPGKLIHALPDDSDLAYHVSLGELSKPDFDEITTAKNQQSDRIKVIVRRPLKGIIGEVASKDLTYRADKVFWMERQESLVEMDGPSDIGDIQAHLQYLERDADRTANTDDPISGVFPEPRVSATGSQNALDQALKPALVLVKYVLHQWIPWRTLKYAKMWHLYALEDQILEITGEDEHQTIKPSQLYGDFKVVMDVVDEYADNITLRQNLAFILNQLGQLPNFAQVVDTAELLKSAFEITKLDKSPGRFIRPEQQDKDAERIANIENHILVEMQDWDQPQPGENHATHLRIHQGLEAEYLGIEDDFEEGWLENLRAHIQITQQLQQQGQAPAQAPAEAPPGNQSVGESVGNQFAAVQGAIGGGAA